MTKSGTEFSKSFQTLFSLNTEDYIYKSGHDIFELGVISNKTSLDWFKKINNYRKSVAHSGSKSYGLVKKEVKFIRDIYNSLKIQVDEVFYNSINEEIID